MPPMQVDVLIRGDGAVGRSLALALSHQGLRVGLQGRAQARPQDVRAYALNAGAQALLRRLKVWDSLPPDAKTPVQDMQVFGDQAGGRLNFSAWQSHLPELAVIVDAAELDTALDAALRFAPHVQRVEQSLPHQLLALCEGREARGRRRSSAHAQAAPSAAAAAVRACGRAGPRSRLRAGARRGSAGAAPAIAKPLRSPLFAASPASAWVNETTTSSPRIS